VTISPTRGRAPAKRTITKFGMRGRVADVIICFKFYRNRLGVSELWGAKMGVFHWLWPSPLQQVSTTVLPVMGLTTVQRISAACEVSIKSLLTLRLSNRIKPNCFSLSSYCKCCIPVTSLVALLCTLSINLISLSQWGQFSLSTGYLSLTLSFGMIPKLTTKIGVWKLEL